MLPSAKRNGKPSEDEIHVGGRDGVEVKPRKGRIREVNYKMAASFCTAVGQSPEQSWFKGDFTYEINLSSSAIF